MLNFGGSSLLTDRDWGIKMVIQGRRMASMADIRLAQRLLGPEQQRLVKDIDQQVFEALNGIIESLKFVESINLFFMKEYEKSKTIERLQDEQQKIMDIRSLYKRLQEILERQFRELQIVNQEIKENKVLQSVTEEQAVVVKKTLTKALKEGRRWTIIGSFFLGIIASLIANFLWNVYYAN